MTFPADRVGLAHREIGASRPQRGRALFFRADVYAINVFARSGGACFFRGEFEWCATWGASSWAQGMLLSNLRSSNGQLCDELDEQIDGDLEKRGELLCLLLTTLLLLMERFPLSTSETRPRVPNTGSKSLAVRPLVFIR